MSKSNRRRGETGGTGRRREVFLANGLAGLKSRDVDGRDEKIVALEKALAETALGKGKTLL